MKNWVEISSSQNPLVKELVSYQKASQRLKTGSFLIEGVRELEKAIQAGYQIQKLIINSDLLAELELFNHLDSSCQLIKMDKQLFSKFAYRARINNLVALAKCKSHDLADIRLPLNPLIVVLENMEKPGNMGAVLRTCDAAGVDALFICEAKTDLYNPNVVRSSLGCLFTNQVAVGSSQDAIGYLKGKEIQIFVSSLDAAENFFSMDYSKSCALVLGSEAYGISDQWLVAADQKIKIPMKGKADSMNVSNAAAVMIYEVVRQRSPLDKL